MLASVDSVFAVLDSWFASGPEIFFRQFVHRSATVKWMIGADFVINEPAAVHDAFAFTIFPHLADFNSVQAEIGRVFPCDIKHTRSITGDMLNYLRSPKRFHFCFLAEKTRHDRDTVHQARVAIDRAIATIRGLDTGGAVGGEELREAYLRRFRELRQEANANSFNYRLLSDIGMLSMLAAAVMFWIVRHGEADVFGVFPDRDKMTFAYNGIFNEITAINFSSLCQQNGVSENRVTLLPAQTLLGGRDLFYDPLVRTPDYVAGSIARLDYRARLVTSDHKKHGDLVEKFVSDNTNLAIAQIAETVVCVSAANISLWSHSDLLALLAQTRPDHLLEYSIAKSTHFRKMRRRSHRESLLNEVKGMETTSYHLAVLMRGVAAGDPSSVATFTGGDRASN